MTRIECVYRHKCEKCAHIWIPRTRTTYPTCPKCHTVDMPDHSGNPIFLKVQLEKLIEQVYDKYEKSEGGDSLDALEQAKDELNEIIESTGIIEKLEEALGVKK